MATTRPPLFELRQVTDSPQWLLFRNLQFKNVRRIARKTELTLILSILAIALAIWKLQTHLKNLISRQGFSSLVTQVASIIRLSRVSYSCRYSVSRSVYRILKIESFKTQNRHVYQCQNVRKPPIVLIVWFIQLHSNATGVSSLSLSYSRNGIMTGCILPCEFWSLWTFEF